MTTNMSTFLQFSLKINKNIHTKNLKILSSQIWQQKYADKIWDRHWWNWFRDKHCKQRGSL